jgi:hypothetical protein
MNQAIRKIASLITEDPDVSADRETILLEWGDNRESQFQHPVEQQLEPLIDRQTVDQLTARGGMPQDQAIQRAMDDLMMEFQAFQRHSKLPTEKAIAAFTHYKRHKELPPDMVRDSAELDRMGGRDFRPGV